MNEEEIRLIKGYFNDGYCCDLDELKEIANKMIDQLQQKENIKKEVREYIVTHKLYNFKYDDEELFEIVTDEKAKDELLEILDKEVN